MSTDTLADERVRAAVPSAIGGGAVAAAAVIAAGRAVPGLGQLVAIVLTLFGGYGAISLIAGTSVAKDGTTECGCEPAATGVKRVPMTRRRVLLAGVCAGCALAGLLALAAVAVLA